MAVTFYPGTPVLFEGAHALCQSASTTYQDPNKYFWAMGDDKAYDSATDIKQWSMSFTVSGFTGISYNMGESGDLTASPVTVVVGATGCVMAFLSSASVSVDSLGLPSTSLTYTCFGPKSSPANPAVTDTHAPAKGVSLACSDVGVKAVSFSWSRNIQLVTELGNAVGYAVLADIPTLTGNIDMYSGAFAGGTFTLGGLSISGLRVIDSGPKANVGSETLFTTYVAWDPEVANPTTDAIFTF